MIARVRRVNGAVLFGSIAVSACVLLAAAETRAQTAEEHASHHPDQTATPAQPGASPSGKTPGMGDMSEMMKSMGAPPPKELYPSLMALPELSPEQRKQVEEQAAERMHAGSTLMAHALDALNAATQ